MDRTGLAVLTALLTLSLGCSSYTIRRADSAAEAGDYETARELYHHAATDGMNGYARLQLAKIYEEGLAGEPNPAEAAKGGNAYAQYQMGLLSESGEGVPRDLDQAREWYTLASQGDMLAAQQRLRALGGG